MREDKPSICAQRRQDAKRTTLTSTAEETGREVQADKSALWVHVCDVSVHSLGSLQDVDDRTHVVKEAKVEEREADDLGGRSGHGGRGEAEEREEALEVHCDSWRRRSKLARKTKRERSEGG